MMVGRGQPGGWRQRKISMLKLQLGQLGKGYLDRAIEKNKIPSNPTILVWKSGPPGD